jgi:TonB family protein
MRLDEQLPDRGHGAPVRPGGSSWPMALAALLVVLAGAGFLLVAQLERAKVAERARVAERVKAITRAMVSERTRVLERAKAIAQVKGVERARAVGSPATWLTSDDYPPLAVENNEQGVVAIVFIIDRTGRVSDCAVAQSSESKRLDDRTCALMKERARYTPARDAKGRPAEWTGRLRFRWQIEE